jgi:hypothetical protein
MTEPAGITKDYGAMTPQELRKDLEGYDFVNPAGEPLAPLLDSLIKEPMDPKKIADTCESIEGKHFECQGGPLRNCDPWIELRRRLGAPSAWK